MASIAIDTAEPRGKLFAGPRVRRLRSQLGLTQTRMAEELGTVKAANVILLGALIKAMGLDDIDWDTIVRNNVKAKFADLNAEALKKGMEAAAG